MLTNQHESKFCESLLQAYVQKVTWARKTFSNFPLKQTTRCQSKGAGNRAAGGKIARALLHEEQISLKEK